MELDNKCISVLKNFAGVNPSIVIDQGNTIKTISEAKNVIASATVEQTFDQQFGIYDLNEFLNVVSLVDQPRLRFEENNVLIGDMAGRSTIRYYFTDTDMVTRPPEKFNMPEPDVKFILTHDVLNRLKRAASALGHSELAITPNNGSVALTIQDSENATSNSFSIDVDGEYDVSNFKFICNISYLKLLPDDYEVGISSKLISHYQAMNEKVEYFIALEKSSTYGE